METIKRIVYDYPTALKLYTEFCVENKLEVKLPYSEPSNDDEMNTNAYKMIKDIRLVVNKGEILNPLDTNQRKYFPWFIPLNSGVGLSCHVDGHWATITTVPARLCSVDSESVKSITNKYQPIYDILQS